MKLSTKFLALSGLTVVLLAGQIGFSYYVSKRKDDYENRQRIIFEVVNRHYAARLSTASIRADVLSAVRAEQLGDPSGITEAKGDYTEDAKELHEQFNANSKESLPASIGSAYQKALEEIDGYNAAAARIIDTALRNGNAAADYPEFEKAFARQKAINLGITQQLREWSQASFDEASGFSHSHMIYATLISLLTLPMVASLPLLALFTLFRPQQRMIDLMNDIAQGHYDTEVSGVGRADELGDIARAVEVFRNNGLERQALEEEQAKARDTERAEARKRAERGERTEQFAGRMQTIIQSVAAAATELYQTSEQMGHSIAGTSQRLHNVTAASAETAMSVQTVAAAAEELSATVREIAQQISRSGGNVQSAVERVAQADAIAASLGTATEQIGKIVDVIQGIANQINLLALNATIESARAGEAGKGFAVVAGEVKTLATQTSKATDEIASNINSIQEVSQQVIATLGTIKTAISSVEETSSAISAAVEEQNATTNSIASSMGTAAEGTRQIDSDIREVNSATEESSTSAGQVLDAAKMLSQQAEQLRGEVEGFMREISAA